MAKARRADINAEVDELYAAPLAEFTARRNELAKGLREAGRPDDAERVKALKKPSVPAGAINRAVRADPGAAKALLAAGEGLRDANADALAGGDADALREAMGAEAEAVAAMLGAVEAAAEGPLGAAMLDRVRDTLRAVAGDEELRAEFEAGRVERDRKPVGLGGAPAASSGKRKRGRPAKRPSAAQRKRAEQRLTRAQKALDASRVAVAEAEEDLNEARASMKAAERRVAAAKEDRSRASSELEAAEAARSDLDAS